MERLRKDLLHAMRMFMHKPLVTIVAIATLAIGIGGATAIFSVLYIAMLQQLAERLELHRLRCGNPRTGPILANVLGKPLAMVTHHKSVHFAVLEPLRTVREARVISPQSGPRV